MLQTALRPNQSRRQVSRDATIPAPVEGWDASTPLSAMPPTRAVELTNWFPQPGWVEVRRGSAIHAFDMGVDAITVSGINTTTDVFTAAGHAFSDGDQIKINAATTMPAPLVTTSSYFVRDATASTFKLAETDGGAAINITSAGAGTITAFSLETRPVVQSLMPYQGIGSSSALFAAAGNAIWDVSLKRAATFSTGGSFGSNQWQHVNFATTAGNFLFLVNGTDAPIYYDGSAWTTPTITGTGITATDFIGVTAHKSRLWFTVNDSSDAAYMGTLSVAGTATIFPLGPLFTKGGNLLAIESWTLDGGAGPDDYLAFISERGQVALYSGTDPASASTWTLVGTFDLGEPIGRRCSVKYGAEPLLITQSGLLKMRLSMQDDQAQLEGKAYTARIYQAMTEAARNYSTNFGWQVISYPKGNMLIMNVPTAESVRSEQYVMNTLTGAWCKFEAWNANQFAVYNNALYYAGNGGDVVAADVGATDQGVRVTATGQTAYLAFGNTGRTKHFKMLKALVRSTATNRPQLGISVDFVETFNVSTLPSTEAVGALWDVFKWDQGKWSSDDTPVSDWSSVQAFGVWGSVKFQASTGSTAGGSIWGVSRWGDARWGGSVAEENMVINGFVTMFEVGAYL